MNEIAAVAKQADIYEFLYLLIKNNHILNSMNVLINES